MTEPYLVPVAIASNPHRIETEVARSRFIAMIARAETVEQARAFIHRMHTEMPDANHHVYAFRIGHGQSVTEGMSDDGEPTGTSGPPVLAAVRGSGIGDIVLVITRYFGGTKLGTGGLVRAYSEAAHTALNSLLTEPKIEKGTVGVETPYGFYQPIHASALYHEGQITEATFASTVTLIVVFPLSKIPSFTAEVRDLTAGQVQVILMD